MSEDFGGGDELRAARKAERREQKRTKTKNAPIVGAYGVWTGEGYLREGEGLERKLALESVKAPTGARREKRRKRKNK